MLAAVVVGEAAEAFEDGLLASVRAIAGEGEEVGPGGVAQGDVQGVPETAAEEEEEEAFCKVIKKSFEGKGIPHTLPPVRERGL